jgi:hypothetical protein
VQVLGRGSVKNGAESTLREGSKPIPNDLRDTDQGRAICGPISVDIRAILVR